MQQEDGLLGETSDVTASLMGIEWSGTGVEEGMKIGLLSVSRDDRCQRRSGREMRGRRA